MGLYSHNILISLAVAANLIEPTRIEERRQMWASSHNILISLAVAVNLIEPTHESLEGMRRQVGLYSHNILISLAVAVANLIE
ncbi:hypothetical protein J6590_028289 [Homalodisca vitripennis]|nr:hypothetical protein J6590_028289 [Homalodisca vitripennis]